MKPNFDKNLVGELLYTIERSISTRIIGLIIPIIITIMLIIPINLYFFFIDITTDPLPGGGVSALGKDVIPCIILIIIILIIIIFVLFYISILKFIQPYYLLLFEKGLVINYRIQGKFFPAPKTYGSLLIHYHYRYRDYFIPLNKIKEAYILQHPLSLRDYGSIVIKEMDGRWHWIDISDIGPNSLMEKLTATYGNKWNKIYRDIDKKGK